jgi:flagellar biosynthesis protein
LKGKIMDSGDDKNKMINKAVAIKYSDDKNNPKSAIARGSGSFAEKMIIEAVEKGIPIYKDEDLLNKLTNLDFLKDVPEDLYNVAADVMEFVYKMDESFVEIKKD